MSCCVFLYPIFLRCCKCPSIPQICAWTHCSGTVAKLRSVTVYHRLPHFLMCIQGFFHLLHVFGSHLVVITGDPPKRESLPSDSAFSIDPAAPAPSPLQYDPPTPLPLSCVDSSALLKSFKRAKLRLHRKAWEATSSKSFLELSVLSRVRLPPLLRVVNFLVTSLPQSTLFIPAFRPPTLSCWTYRRHARSRRAVSSTRADTFLVSWVVKSDPPKSHYTQR